MLRRCVPPPTEVARVEFWDMDRFALALAQDDGATVRSLEGPVFKIVSGERSTFCAYCYLTRASYAIAPRLAHVGRKEEALNILLRMVEVDVAPSYDWLLREPDIQLLRGDPRFGKVLAASRDGAALLARLLREAQTRGELPVYLEQPLDELVRLLRQSDT